MNTINTKDCDKINVKKKSFKLKPNRKDGLCLRLHHTTTMNGKLQSIRFHLASYNCTGNLLATVNHEGSLVIINFTINKYWIVNNIPNCSVIKFSPSVINQIIAGTTQGKLHIIDAEEGGNGGEIDAHSESIADISLTNNDLCISSTSTEAIIWNVQTKAQLQRLQVESGTNLKIVMFISESNHILACYQDDSIQMWRGNTFEPLKQIQPTTANKMTIRTIACTQNGRAIVFGGHSQQIYVFLTDVWAVAQVITLPEYVQAVRKLEFVSLPFDGGTNRVLSILSSSGIVVFYNMEQDCVVSKLKTDTEIHKITMAPQAKHVACIMNSGDVYVYNLQSYLGIAPKPKSSQKVIPKPGKSTKDVTDIIHKEIKTVLNINKLKGILREFGEYPSIYRKTIWSHLLKLPNNKDEYDQVLSNELDSPFTHLETKYPIENKQELKNLKRALNNIVYWCPFFSCVNYLPNFCYPFVKIFQNEPVLAFEAIVSIITNYSQYWFEYHPFPPLNVLGIIENILMEHEPKLLAYLNANDVNSKIYAWQVLQTSFSEVLTGHEWLILWDHIFSNEPHFLPLAVVAYTITNKHQLLSLSGRENFVHFYSQQNATDFRKFISKIYDLQKSTSEESHPKRYMERFKVFESYPKFTAFPKNSLQFKAKITELKQESSGLLEDKKQLLSSKSEVFEKMKRNQVEFIRQSELEQVYQKQIEQERVNVHKQRDDLEILQNQFEDKDVHVLYMTPNELLGNASDVNQTSDEKMTKPSKVKTVLDELVGQYQILSSHKIQIEKLLKDDTTRKLPEEITKASSIMLDDAEYLKQLNVATGIAAMDGLIKKIEFVLNERQEKGSGSSKQIRKLQTESRELVTQVNKLMELLAKMK